MSFDVEIDDELEVEWRPGSARSERCVWVLFTAQDGTPFVTGERWLLDAEVLIFHSEVIFPLIDGDRVLSKRKVRR
jgi:hypothetical protein